MVYDYYDDISEGYDELHKEEQLAKLKIIKKELKVKKGDRLLDVGCGTGISMCFACKQVGVDPSEGLLAKAKGEVVKGCAESLPFEDGSFDIVVSVTAIQNFTDVSKALKEMKRVGRKTFVISCLKKSKKMGKIDKLIRKEFKIQKIIEEEKDMIYFLAPD